MSGDDEAGNPGNLPAVQTVGYGRPPVEHRFRKGVSGNPKGRPRGSRNANSKPLNPADKPTSRMILEEAYRPITIREGDKVIELPAIQAVMRAMGVSAMKGNRLAQKTLAEIVQSVEAHHSAERQTMFENAFEYKLQWTREIERCRAAGLPDPAPVPHPDDIILDMRVGTVKTAGPLSKEEKAEWDLRIARRDEAQAEVTAFAEEWRKSRSPSRTEMWLSEWHFEQRIFDIINDSLPERYKAKLTDRSYREGASREGHTLREFMEDRKRPRKARRFGEYVEDG